MATVTRGNHFRCLQFNLVNANGRYLCLPITFLSCLAAMFCAVIVDFFRCARHDQENEQKLAGSRLRGGIQGGINAVEQFSQLSVGHLSSNQEWHRYFAQWEIWLIGRTWMLLRVPKITQKYFCNYPKVPGREPKTHLRMASILECAQWERWLIGSTSSQTWPRGTLLVSQCIAAIFLWSSQQRRLAIYQ